MVLLINGDFDPHGHENNKAISFLVNYHNLKADIFSDALLCEPDEIGDVSDLDEYPSRKFSYTKEEMEKMEGHRFVEWILIIGLFILPIFIGWFVGYLYDTTTHGADYALAHPNGVAMTTMAISLVIWFIFILTEDPADMNVKKTPEELMRRFIFILVIPTAVAWVAGFLVDMNLNGIVYALANPNFPAILGTLIESAILFGTFIFIQGRTIWNSKAMERYKKKMAAKSSS